MQTCKNIIVKNKQNMSQVLLTLVNAFKSSVPLANACKTYLVFSMIANTHIPRARQNVYDYILMAGDFSTEIAQALAKAVKWQGLFLIALRFVSLSLLFFKRPPCCPFLQRGYPRHIWVSCSTALRLDALRDFLDLGAKGVNLIDGSAGVEKGLQKLFNKLKKAYVCCRDGYVFSC